MDAVRKHFRRRPLRSGSDKPVGEVEPNDLFAVGERSKDIVRPVIADAGVCMPCVIRTTSARENCRKNDLRLRLAFTDAGEYGLHTERRLPGLCGVAR